MRQIALIQEPDGSWRAACAEIPGYLARGETRQDALRAMKRALTLYYPCGECDEEEGEPGGPPPREASNRPDGLG